VAAKAKLENEAYYTPAWPVRLLLEHWTPPQEGLWVEPAVGSGNIVRAMNETYSSKEWVGYDINPTGRALLGDIKNLRSKKLDFLSLGKEVESDPHQIILRELRREVTLAMTNPPFSLAGSFLAQCRRLYPKAYIMFLLRLGFLASKDRASLWPAYGEPDLFILANRPSFTEDGETDKYDYAWYGFPKVPRTCGSVVHLPHVDLVERQRGFLS
jgi:hypothetical protein